MKLSGNHRLVAWTAEKERGSENYWVYIKEAATDRIFLDEVIGGSVAGMEFSSDGQYLLYCLRDDTIRPFK
ncbi:unnamed protein product, partial [Ostreobium quekettii]